MCILDKNKDNLFSLNISLNTVNDVKDFVSAVTPLDCKVTVADGDYIIDGKSILGMFSFSLYNSFKVYVPMTHAEELIKVINKWIIEDK